MSLWRQIVRGLRVLTNRRGAITSAPYRQRSGGDDPGTYLGVVAVLLIVSAIACSVPAWQAARVDPAITLRAE